MPQQSSMAAGVTTWEGRGGRMAEKSGGSNRNDENWKKSFIRKKAVWKRRKVEKFWGNARLV